AYPPSFHHLHILSRTVIMSQRLRKYASFLKLLHSTKPSLQKKMLRTHCNNEFVQCIVECCRNIIKGNLKLTPLQKANLVKRKRILKKIVLKKTSLKNKRKIIQTGGFLGAILGPIVKVLGGLFAS